MTMPLRAIALLLLLPALTMEEKELFGRSLPTLTGRPAIVLYANQATQKMISAPMTELSFRLRDLHPVTLVRVDLSGLPKLFTGFALSTMRSEYAKGERRYNELCRQAGIATPSQAEAEASFFMSYDPVGSPHRALGLSHNFRQAIAIAYDAEGRQIAQVRFPEEADRLEAAIRASAKQNAPESHPGTDVLE